MTCPFFVRAISFIVLVGLLGLLRPLKPVTAVDGHDGWLSLLEGASEQSATGSATEKDRTREAAQRALTEGSQLRNQKTAESLRQAIEKFKEALPLWRAVEDRAGEAETLHGLGWVCSLLGEQRNALEYYQQALPLWRAVGDRRGEAQTLTYMGAAYTALGDQLKALDHHNQALPLWRAAQDRAGEAETFNHMGIAYRALSEPQQALAYYDQSLSIRRALGDRSGEAETLNNIGVIYAFSGEPQKALEYYQQSLPLFQALGDPRREANTLSNIGAIYDALGERQKALDAYYQALPMRRAAGDRRGEALTLHNIAATYSALGERERALDYYHQALQQRRSIEDRRGEAQTLNNIGRIYFFSGDREKALEYSRQALVLQQAIKDRGGEAETLNNIGRVYAAQDEKPKARDCYNRALSLSRAAGHRRAEAETLGNMGALYAAWGDAQKALDYFRQALALWRAVVDRNREAGTLYAIARTERERGHLDEASRQSEAALAIVESLRTKVASQELRAAYLASKQSQYEFSMDLLMQRHHRHPSQGYDAAALHVSERARARSLLEMLTEVGADIRQGVDVRLLEQERALQQQFNAKEQYRTQLLGGKHTDAQASAIEKELNGLLTQYQEVQGQIRARSPRYAALTQPQPLRLPEIQQQVLDEDTLLLEYALGEERSYLWAVTPTAMASFELPKRTEIESAARRMYESLTARNRRVQGETDAQRRRRLAQAVADYPAAADILSRMLLGPVAEQLGSKRLLIVSDGILHYVPFGALPVPTAPAPHPGEMAARGNSRKVKAPFSSVTATSLDHRTDFMPLGVAHELVTLPSASTLAVLRREIAGRPPAPKIIAVLADPVFQADDPRVRPIKTPKGTEPKPRNASHGRAATPSRERSVSEWVPAEAGSYLSRLPFSRQEAEGILTLTPADQRMNALDFAASRATATSAELGRYRIIHFATHGLLNSTHPELSGIVLSLVDEEGAPQDGFLRLHEIYNLNLPADLMVLSACQTGLGKEVQGEGLVGLTRGFMYAGAARVVASLWKVDDTATAELMKRFYQGLLGPERLRPAAALRAAQVSLWKERRWHGPYYWAAFILQGEWK